MALGHGGRLFVVLVAASLAAASCSTGPSRPAATGSNPASSSTTSTTVARPTTTTVPATTTTVLTVADLGMEVLVPQGEGPFPAIVTVHGGAWVIGSPALMRPLARFLTDAGYLTVNTSYQLATNQAASFPAAVDDIACAVRIAAAHPLSDGTVVLIGHSAGGHLALHAAGEAIPGIAAVIALGPVADLGEALERDLDGGAARAFLGEEQAHEYCQIGRAHV